MDTNRELKLLEYQKQFLNYEGEDKVVAAQELLARLLAENKKAHFFHTGIGSLDELCGGFKRGQLVVLSAATGEGKTSFAQTLTKSFTEQGGKCLWFSYEVGVEDFMEKMPEGTKIFYMPQMVKQNSMVWLRDRIAEGIVKHNTRIVFIDHLHYLLEMQKMAEAKSLSLLIGMMMRELKKLAIDFNILIFLISHMRKTEAMEEPGLEDLRDSSFVAQESDFVLMMWRERERRDGETCYLPTTKVFVKKNRRLGKLGCIKVKYENNLFVDDTFNANFQPTHSEINPQEIFR